MKGPQRGRYRRNSFTLCGRCVCQVGSMDKDDGAMFFHTRVLYEAALEYAIDLHHGVVVRVELA